MSKNENYIESIEEMVQDWQAQIENLASKAYGLNEQSSSNLRDALHSLQEKQRQSEVKLEELKAAGEEDLDDFKKGFEKLRDNIEQSIDKAQSAII